jgi:hypothetical protein
MTLASDVDEDHPATIFRDGQGGVLVGYEAYWSLDSSTWCQQMSAARVDAFGSLLWTEYPRHCDHSQPVGQPPTVNNSPHSIQVVGDGSGGGIFAWIMHDESSNDDEEVLAQGIAADGGKPTAQLTMLLPDAARPGDTGTYLIFGEYLDLSLGFELVHESGSPSFELTPDQMHSYQLLEGLTTLSGLDPGAYHLVVETSGTPQDTLQFAVGIGTPPACGEDEPFLETENNVNLEGSQRQSAIDRDGGIHMTWVAQDATTGDYSLMYQRRSGSEPPGAIYVSRRVLRHPTLAVDALNRVHLAVVRENSPTAHTVVRIRLNEGLDIEEMDEWGGIYQHYRPVIAITGDTTVHIVFETAGTPGTSSTQLEHVMNAGTNWHYASFVIDRHPRDPDMVAMDEDLLLTYVQDSLIPGIQEVKFKVCRAGLPPNWQPAEVLSFGLRVASPSVAWDGAGRALFAWIIDNEAINGIPPLVHTVEWENASFGEKRARPGQTQHHAVSVGSTGPGKFTMLTLESEGGPDMGVWLRDGDGRCFFPRVQLNSNLDVDTPMLATSRAGGERMVHWRDYRMAILPVHGSYCAGIGTGVPKGQVPAIFSRELRCSPNPFNPSTTLSFELSQAGPTRIVIYDARGRRVRGLLDTDLPAGHHDVVWDGRDDRKVELGSGVYFGRLIRPGGESSISKVALVR